MKVILAILLSLFGCAVCRPSAASPSTSPGIQQPEPQDICYLRLATQSCNGQVTVRLSTEEMQVTQSYDVSEPHICVPVSCSDRNLAERVTLDLLEENPQRFLTSFNLDTTYSDLYITRAECKKAERNGFQGSSLEVLCDPGDVNFGTSNQKEKRYQNSMDQPLLVTCNNRYAFNRIRSWHHNGYEDRQYQFDCEYVAEAGFDQCWWSDYVNSFDKPAMYHCPANSLLTGVSSYHSNRAEDRRWKFQCCNFPNYHTKSCQSSGYLNWFDKYIDYCSPSDTFFTGAYSYHENKQEDRRWMIQTCNYTDTCR